MSYNETSKYEEFLYVILQPALLDHFFLFHKLKFRVVFQISEFFHLAGKLSHFELKSPSICSSHVAGEKSCLLCITWQILDQGQLKNILYHIENSFRSPHHMIYHGKLFLRNMRTLYNLNVQLHCTNTAVKCIFLYLAFDGSAITLPI